MRHLMSSFLALHWAVVFALLAFVCIGGLSGLEGVLSTVGAARNASVSLRVDGALVTVPLASAFLIVSALFCWALIEINLGEGENSADSVLKIGFVAAGSVFLVILVYGTARGVGGLFLPSGVHIAALAASYLAVLGEGVVAAQSRALPVAASRTAAHAMARGAAHASLLSRISGRPDSGARS